MVETLLPVVGQRTFSSRETLLDHLALALLDAVHAGLQSQEQFRLVLGGGRTQAALNERIVALSQPAPDWSRVLILLSDERCVPLDHVQSNFRLNLETLVRPLGMPEENIKAMLTDLGPERAAKSYADLLERLFAVNRDYHLDLALLGLGPDGHTASLFPGSPALDVVDALAAPAGPGPEGHDRITLTFPALNMARQLWIMATGKEKHPPVARLLKGPHTPPLYPVQSLSPSGGLTLWLDSAAHDPTSHKD
ncbi:6-phosphogluconolactonase [Desulfonatronum parangueonense]